MTLDQRAPMRVGGWWMIGTLVAYLLLGDKDGVPALLTMVAFVVVATLLWALGYRHGVSHFPTAELDERYGNAGDNEARQTTAARRWILASSIYFALYGWQLLLLYGATPATFVQVITNPGQAYAAKFEIIEGLSTQTGNTFLQLLILGSLLQLPLGPLVGYFWDRLSTWLRLVAVAGFATYVSFFLYIGTMQGLGFLLAGLFAGVLARQHRAGNLGKRITTKTRRRARIVIAVAAAVFVVYMANAQAGRLAEFSVTDRFQANPVLAAVTGEDFARGLAVVVHYPTHGYGGLAHNLDTALSIKPTWTAGLGFSRAVDSYWEQYVGESAFEQTYPALTEDRTGYSATVVWATVYPWLASDLTFPGVLLLMFLIGRWTARMWLRATRYHDPICLMLFSQLMLFVLFVPVNNQALISRPALIGVVSCVGLYALRELRWLAATRGARYSSADRSRYPSPVSR